MRRWLPILVLLAAPLGAQVCSETTTLRIDKGSYSDPSAYLSMPEVDANFQNVIDLCAGQANTVTVCSAGCDYDDFSDAVDYVTTQSPGSGSPWSISLYPGTYTEAAAITIPDYTNVSGAGGVTTGVSVGPPLSIIQTTLRTGAFLTLGDFSNLDDLQITTSGVGAPTGDFYTVSYDGTQSSISGSRIHSGFGDNASYRSVTIRVNSTGTVSLRESWVSTHPGTDNADSAAIYLADGDLRLSGTVVWSQGDSPAVYLADAGSNVWDFGGNSYFSSGSDLIDITTVGGTYTSYALAETDVAGEVLGTADNGAAIPVQSGAIPTCDASYGRGLTEDQTGDLCYCDTSSWVLVAGGGSCA